MTNHTEKQIRVNARARRSSMNKAALRIVQDGQAFRTALAAIKREVLRLEGERGRELLPDEVDGLCDRLDFDDVVEFIRGRQEP